MKNLLIEKKVFFKYTEELFCFLLFIILLHGINSNNLEMRKINYIPLSYEDAFGIGIFNGVSIFIQTILSLLGIGIPVVLKTIYKIGQSSSSYEFSVTKYFLYSFFHGIFEFYALFFVFKVNIDSIKYIRDIVFNKNTTFHLSIYKKYAYTVLKKYVIIFLLLVLFGIVEVFISNRLLLKGI